MLSTTAFTVVWKPSAGRQITKGRQILTSPRKRGCRKRYVRNYSPQCYLEGVGWNWSGLCWPPTNRSCFHIGLHLSALPQSEGLRRNSLFCRSGPHRQQTPGSSHRQGRNQTVEIQPKQFKPGGRGTSKRFNTRWWAYCYSDTSLSAVNSWRRHLKVIWSNVMAACFHDGLWHQSI